MSVCYLDAIAITMIFLIGFILGIFFGFCVKFGKDI